MNDCFIFCSDCLCLDAIIRYMSQTALRQQPCTVMSASGCSPSVKDNTHYLIISCAQGLCDSLHP